MYLFARRSAYLLFTILVLLTTIKKLTDRDTIYNDTQTHPNLCERHYLPQPSEMSIIRYDINNTQNRDEFSELLRSLRECQPNTHDRTVRMHPKLIGSNQRRHTPQSNMIASICCLVLSTPNAFDKVKAINDTWAKRCNMTLYFTDRQFDFPNVVYLESERVGDHHRTEKVVKAFQFVQKHYSNYDWYLKVDDDTYIIVENLRILLSYFNFKEPIYIGRNFKYLTKHAYSNVSAGYVMSKLAFWKLLHGTQSGRCQIDGQDEVANIEKCLNCQGVETYDTMDIFHEETKDEYPEIPLRPLLQTYPAVKAKNGLEPCSSSLISLHYVQPASMYVVDMLLYHITVFGRHYNKSKSV